MLPAAWLKISVVATMTGALFLKWEKMLLFRTLIPGRLRCSEILSCNANFVLSLFALVSATALHLASGHDVASPATSAYLTKERSPFFKSDHHLWRQNIPYPLQ